MARQNSLRDELSYATPLETVHRHGYASTDSLTLNWSRRVKRLSSTEHQDGLNRCCVMNNAPCLCPIDCGYPYQVSMASVPSAVRT